eukprot:TRINITY_DN76202_c0_g1_i1.p1 TRINITY_DN76202_c0_g1~~TRINITY_DN76202_c0_g1_i1.p1  ORF type:complete len:219 (+),score=35.59 TRINITY_DN76202_c0_g1_i1:60-716(+)
MPKPLATILHEGFEKNGALRLPADHFLLILRRAGATISYNEGVKLIRFLDVDDMGCVDARKFCAWLEGMEKDPRFSKLVPTALAPRNADETLDEALQPENERSSSANASAGFEQEHEAVDDTANLAADGAVYLVGQERGDEDDERDDERATWFSRLVSSDDGDDWSLASEDKYSLPERRRLTEHEQLKARLTFALNQVKARLETYPVKFRPELRAKVV